jgi:hypothetical protein
MSVGGISSIQYGYIVSQRKYTVEMALRSEGIITIQSQHPEETWQLSLVIVVNSHSLKPSQRCAVVKRVRMSRPTLEG